MTGAYHSHRYTENDDDGGHEEGSDDHVFFFGHPPGSVVCSLQRNVAETLQVLVSLNGVEKLTNALAPLVQRLVEALL